MPKIYMNGQELTLFADPTMPPGREGTVYPDPSDPASVIKLPHTPDDEWREKLHILLTNPLSAPDVAWPTEAVYSTDHSTVIGCRLPYAAKKHPIAAVFSTDPTTRWIQACYAFRLEVAINLAAAVNRVHQHGCVVGDLSPNNILVGKNAPASVSLIDMDSIQITRNGKTYRCKYGFLDYTPAELYQLDLADIDRTVYHDAFGLTCIIFQLLIGPGIHPFAMRYLGTGLHLSLLDRIHLGIWPYAINRHPDYAPRTDAPLDLLHPILQPLVCRCFENGHSHPTERPLPADWLLALTEVKQDTDFVRITAPRLEAEAQARYRQAILAASRPHSMKIPPAQSAFTKVRSKVHIRFHQKMLYPIAAATILLFAGSALHFAKTKPTQIDFVKKTTCPLPTPVVYKHLAAPWQNFMQQPPNRTAQLPTPTLYEHMAHDP
jgi:DNA-binding helix-hairpin-helix protein with protein kinase domain